MQASLDVWTALSDAFGIQPATSSWPAERRRLVVVRDHEDDQVALHLDAMLLRCDADVTRADRRALLEIAQGGHAWPKQLADALNVTHQAARQRIDRLHGAGLLRLGEDGWKVTEPPPRATRESRIAARLRLRDEAVLRNLQAGPARISDLSAAIGTCPRPIMESLARLQAAGRVERHGVTWCFAGWQALALPPRTPPIVSTRRLPVPSPKRAETAGRTMQRPERRRKTEPRASRLLDPVVLEAIERGLGSAAAVAGCIGKAKSTAYAVIQRLNAAGKIERVSLGRWAAVEPK